MRRSASAEGLPRAASFSRLLEGAGALEMTALVARRPTVAARSNRDVKRALVLVLMPTAWALMTRKVP